MKMIDEKPTWLPAVAVCERYAIGKMALWRWTQDDELGFPAPIQIRKRNYWRLSDLEAFERRKAMAAGSKAA